VLIRFPVTAVGPRICVKLSEMRAILRLHYPIKAARVTIEHIMNRGIGRLVDAFSKFPKQVFRFPFSKPCNSLMLTTCTAEHSDLATIDSHELSAFSVRAAEFARRLNLAHGEIEEDIEHRSAAYKFDGRRRILDMFYLEHAHEEDDPTGKEEVNAALTLKEITAKIVDNIIVDLCLELRNIDWLAKSTAEWYPHYDDLEYVWRSLDDALLAMSCGITAWEQESGVVLENVVDLAAL